MKRCSLNLSATGIVAFFTITLIIISHLVVSIDYNDSITLSARYLIQYGESLQCKYNTSSELTITNSDCRADLTYKLQLANVAYLAILNKKVTDFQEGDSDELDCQYGLACDKIIADNSTALLMDVSVAMFPVAMFRRHDITLELNLNQENGSSYIRCNELGTIETPYGRCNVHTTGGANWNELYCLDDYTIFTQTVCAASIDELESSIQQAVSTHEIVENRNTIVLTRRIDQYISYLPSCSGDELVDGLLVEFQLSPIVKCVKRKELGNTRINKYNSAGRMITPGRALTMSNTGTNYQQVIPINYNGQVTPDTVDTTLTLIDTNKINLATKAATKDGDKTIINYHTYSSEALYKDIPKVPATSAGYAIGYTIGIVISLIICFGWVLSIILLSYACITYFRNKPNSNKTSKHKKEDKLSSSTTNILI